MDEELLVLELLVLEVLVTTGVAEEAVVVWMALWDDE